MAVSKTSPWNRVTSRSSMLRVLAVGRTIARTSAPAATSWRVTCEPKNPLAPMTSLGAVLMCAARPRKRVGVPPAAQRRGGVPPAAQRRGGVPPPHRCFVYRRRRGSLLASVLAHPAGSVVVKRAHLLGFLAPLDSRLQKAQRVVDVFLPAPLAVARVGDDRDVRRADDGAVTGVAHRIVQLADDATGGLVDDRPQRREGRHMAARKGRHRLAYPGEHLIAALHGACGVLDVVDVRG